MSFRKSTLVLAAAVAFGSTAAMAQPSNGSAPPSDGTVLRSRPVYTQSMQRLQGSADRLRQSIQLLAQKPPGPDRKLAIDKAQEALLETQQAMMALPPHLRTSGTVSTASYDESVRKLMKSADSLRQSIQEMSQQPAGERRDQAIRQAHQALSDTQAAMLAAHQPGSSAQSMGAPGEQKVSSRPADPQQPPAVLVLLPSAQANGSRLAGGCWVRFFDDKGFQGAALTLAGPVDLPKMELGNVWRDWDSAVVGPKATVRTFDNEDFNDRTAVLRPGQSVPDLRDRKLGWFEEVKSARVSCA